MYVGGGSTFPRVVLFPQADSFWRYVDLVAHLVAHWCLNYLKFRQMTPYINELNVKFYQGSDNSKSICALMF